MEWVQRKQGRNSAVAQAKRVSKGKRKRKTVSVLGIAGVSLAASTGGSPANILSATLVAPPAGSAADTLWRNTAPFRVPAFDDEEISGVSLATFQLFDSDTIGGPRSGVQLAAFRGGGCGCGHGCGGCGHGCGGGCGHGFGGCRGCGVGGCRGCGVGGCRGCAVGGCGWGGCGGCGGWGLGWGWGGGCCLSWGGCGLC